MAHHRSPAALVLRARSIRRPAPVSRSCGRGVGGGQRVGRDAQGQGQVVAGARRQHGQRGAAAGQPLDGGVRDAVTAEGDHPVDVVAHLRDRGLGGRPVGGDQRVHPHPGGVSRAVTASRRPRPAPAGGGVDQQGDPHGQRSRSSSAEGRASSGEASSSSSAA